MIADSLIAFGIAALTVNAAVILWWLVLLMVWPEAAIWLLRILNVVIRKIEGKF
jgi:hypothetical protein